MTPKTRLSNPEKVTGFSASFRVVSGLSYGMFDQIFSNLAAALTEITGQLVAAYQAGK
jgi:hypothetical protein